MRIFLYVNFCRRLSVERRYIHGRRIYPGIFSSDIDSKCREKKCYGKVMWGRQWISTFIESEPTMGIHIITIHVWCVCPIIANHKKKCMLHILYNGQSSKCMRIVYNVWSLFIQVLCVAFIITSHQPTCQIRKRRTQDQACVGSHARLQRSEL